MPETTRDYLLSIGRHIMASSPTMAGHRTIYGRDLKSMWMFEMEYPTGYVTTLKKYEDIKREEADYIQRYEGMKPWEQTYQHVKCKVSLPPEAVGEGYSNDRWTAYETHHDITDFHYYLEPERGNFKVITRADFQALERFDRKIREEGI